MTCHWSQAYITAKIRRK